MNVLAIGAHFDDIEIGCGGALARHVSRGDNVYAYVATLSGFINHDNVVIRSDDTASIEGKNAMNILGIKLECGDFKTFEVEFTDELSRQLLRIIENQKIDRVYTHWPGDAHHDHRAVARASMHCCRHVPDILAYRSNWYHSDVSFKGNFYIDISGHWGKKEEAIKAHASELARTGYSWIDYFKNEAENAGRRIGVRYAEVYEVIKWLDR